MNIIGIALFGSIGAISRYYISLWLNPKCIKHFQFGTFFVNVIGSFLLGCLASLATQDMLTETWWLSLGVGFLGAFTTFSTFSYELVQLLSSKLYKKALIYGLSSVITCVFFVWVGMILITI